MATGEVDGVVSDLAVGYDLEEKGQGRVLASFGQYVPDFATDVIVASDAIIKGNPAAVKAFLKGWLNTVAFVCRGRSATASERLLFLIFVRRA